MSTKKNLHIETLALHVGQEQPDSATDARAVPIYQTTSYVFRNSQHAADRFGLRDAGNIYGRLTNSTQGVFEDRIAALEGGVAGLAVASGAAAITYALQNIVLAGDHIVAAEDFFQLIHGANIGYIMVNMKPRCKLARLRLQIYHNMCEICLRLSGILISFAIRKHLKFLQYEKHCKT